MYIYIYKVVMNDKGLVAIFPCSQAAAPWSGGRGEGRGAGGDMLVMIFWGNVLVM